MNEKYTQDQLEKLSGVELSEVSAQVVMGWEPFPKGGIGNDFRWIDKNKPERYIWISSDEYHFDEDTFRPDADSRHADELVECVLEKGKSLFLCWQARKRHSSYAEVEFFNLSGGRIFRYSYVLLENYPRAVTIACILAAQELESLR